MKDTERETLADLIDLSVANAQLISTLQREVTALHLALNCLHPDFDQKYPGHFADADVSGEPNHESHLAAAKKLAAARDRIRNKDKQAQT